MLMSFQTRFLANLGLGTYRRPEHHDSKFEFDMFLSTAQEQREARVRTARQKIVHWALGADSDKAKSSFSKPEIMRKLVKQLCEPILRRNRFGAHRLELEVEGRSVYKLQSSRITSQMDTTRPPTTLHALLGLRSGSFTERTKRIMAITLSYTVYYLVDTPWLPADWRSSSVLFFYSTSSEIPMRPFLGSELATEVWSSDSDPRASERTGNVPELDADDLDPDDILPHSSLTIVGLAVALLEIFTATSFEDLGSRYGIAVSDGRLLPDTWFSAQEILRECSGEVPRAWADVLLSCLNPHTWEDEDGLRLVTESLRTQIYLSVIRPLETDLIQAFPDIGVEKLDELAQGLDFNRWGLHRQRGQSVPRVSSSRTPSPLPRHVSSCPVPLDSAFAVPLAQTLPVRSATSLGRGIQRSDSDMTSNTLRSLLPRSLTSAANQRSYNDYTVAVVFAMSFEMSALRFMLDNEHPSLPRMPGDFNVYTLGDLHGHNVVLACLPGQQGKGAASSVATNMFRTFTSVKLRFLVGIGGGVPSAKNDIRLGDVVVSMPDGQHGGVVQYDIGKETDGGFLLKGFMCPPPPLLRSAVEKMRSDHQVCDNRIEGYLSAMIRNHPRLTAYQQPTGSDQLFQDDNWHVSGAPTCAGCDSSRVVARPHRQIPGPAIHYGLIASGDRVLKSSERRSQAVDGMGDVMCFEMEAAGPMSEFPCIVIRGISDYADSHKNDDWHHYAAAMAAACTKELLGYVEAEG